MSPAASLQLVEGVEVVRHRGWAALAAPMASSCLRLDVDEADWIEGALTGDRHLHVDDARFDELAEALVSEKFIVGSAAPRLRSRRWRISVQGVELYAVGKIFGQAHRSLLKHLFHPVVGGIFAVIAVLGTAALAVQLIADVPMATQTMNPFAAALLVLVVDLVATLLHESAHGVVLARYGRAIRSVGFGFYWGAPCFFVDATEALLLPSRRRMLQSAAGPLADVILAGSASLLAVVFPQPLKGVLLLIAVLIWLDVIVNLVPFLELDGYWVVADYLDRPGLRADAQVAAGLMFRHPRRAASWLAVYGFAGLLFGAGMVTAALFGWWYILGDVVQGLASDGVLGVLMLIPLVLPVAASWFALICQLGFALHDRARRQRRASGAGLQETTSA